MIISITFHYSIMFTPHNFNHLDRTSNAKMKKKKEHLLVSIIHCHEYRNIRLIRLRYYHKLKSVEIKWTIL